MTTRRIYDSATVLQDGEVLGVGGEVASAELSIPPPAPGRRPAA